MPQAQIFISYRRDDAAGYARAVYDELARAFGAERVFIDVDDIDAGLPFSDVIQRSVGDSAVLLALIGKRWSGERAGGPPRIADAGDFVRLELAAALAQGLRVIPVLLDGATVPDPARLPPELQALSGRNALPLDNARFAADMARLLREVRAALGEAPQAQPPRRGLPGGRPAGVLLGLVALAGIGWWTQSGPPRRPAPADRPAEAAPAPARAPVDGEWRAEVTYDWPNAHYEERFSFGGEGSRLHGSASFLGVPRGVLDGRIDAAGIEFVTQTSELAGNDSSTLVHHYRGRIDGEQIRFVMQTTGGSSARRPVEFVARRVMPAAVPASR